MIETDTGDLRYCFPSTAIKGVAVSACDSLDVVLDVDECTDLF